MFNRCSLRQWKLSRALDNGSSLSDSLQRHIEGCSTCRQFHEANQLLLTRSEPAEASDERRARIMQAVRADSAKEPGKVLQWLHHPQRFAPALAGAAVVLLMGLWLFQDAGIEQEEEPQLFTSLLNVSLPEFLVKSTESPFEGEVAKLQRDVFRGALFMKRATKPVEGLHGKDRSAQRD